MVDALALFGNPSSLHAEGRRARQAVEEARDRVAALVGGRRDEIVFTSGGTEANQLALRGLGRGRRVVLSPVEHLGFTAGFLVNLPLTGTRTNETSIRGVTTSTSFDETIRNIGLVVGMVGVF